jgi:hypothetical protein
MKPNNARTQGKPKRRKDGIYTVPATNIVTRKSVSPLQVALNRTPLLPAFIKIPRMLYYDQNKTMAITNTGLATDYFYSANGIFDPDITGTGHQPIGFDQIMTFYEQYTVTRSSITCHFRNLADCNLSIALAPDATAVTDPNQHMENGLVVMKANSAFTTENGFPFPELSLDCDVKGYFGQLTEREMLNDNSLYGTAAANPTEQVYFAVANWPGFAIPGSASTVYFDVLLSYDVIFWEPRKVTESLSRELRLKQANFPLECKTCPSKKK